MKMKYRTMGMLICIAIMLIYMSATVRTAYSSEWWNISWHYRVMIVVNSTGYDRTDWPVEYYVNFTDLLNQSGIPPGSGTLDNNSIRLVEYDSAGNLMHELPSQFDRTISYNASTNAFGTLIFTLNGTTSSDTNRSFYVYYDTTENGAKNPPAYSTDLAYAWDGQEINVNNSNLQFYIDTNRSENTSGIHKVMHGAVPIVQVSASQRTTEYLEFARDGSNLSFDLTGNASITYGPVRITIKQEGPEIEWGNLSNQTGEGRIIKKYYIYNTTGSQSYGSWIMIENEFENLAGGSITRYSTDVGALAIDYDAGRFPLDSSISATNVNYTEPSYAYVMGDTATFIGIMNYNETGTTNYLAEQNSLRIGINLTRIDISSGGKIRQTAIAYFGDQLGQSQTDFIDTVRPRYMTPVTITQDLPESLLVTVVHSTDHDFYNKNETIILRVNVSSEFDPYNLTYYVNATLDMGTAGTGDDQTIVLFDDGNHQDNQSGDRVFGNTFNISDIYIAGQWNATFLLYTSGGSLINQSSKTFNVTSVYNLDVTIPSQFKYVLEDFPINATIHIQNYRNDTNVTNTTGNLNITCWFNSTQIGDWNISNMGNGIYYFQTRSPTITGYYLFNCSGFANNNTGIGLDTFYTEKAVTSIIINTSQPSYSSSTVAQKNNDTFSLSVILNNTGNATAQYVNLSLQTPVGWNFTPGNQSCGSIGIGTGCIRQFNVTIPNATAPGDFNINTTVKWYNPNTSVYSNQSQFNVSVLANPLLNVSITNITSTAPEGYEMDVASFLVDSIGNYNLTLVTFNVTGFDQNFTFEFIPNNASNLSAGNSQSVQINVTLLAWHTPGTYNGTINVSSNNNGFQLINISLTVPAYTNLSINTTQPSYSSATITQANNDTYTITVDMNNTGNATARYANVSLVAPANWNFTPGNQSCGSVNISSGCARLFNVTIPNATLPGNYSVNITVEWFNPDSSVFSNQTQFNITVLSNPVINASPSFISVIVGDGTGNQTGNFTISSIGNDNLTAISFSVNGFTNLSFNFTPINLANLSAGSSLQAFLNISAPLHYSAGTYNGTINISSQNNGYSIINLNITVPSNRTWLMSPTGCVRAESPPEGTACVISVTNDGNTVINFSVNPSAVNNTALNTSSFGLLKGESMDINVTYNITSAGPGFYNATYLINTTQSDSIPLERTFSILLVPFIEPLLKIWISHDFVYQGNQTRINVNVTDRSDTGVDYTTVNITTPDNQSFMFRPTKITEMQNGSHKVAHYSFLYPNTTMGNASTRGFYSIDVFAVDNSPNRANATGISNFSVYTNIIPTLETLSGTYYQNSDGLIVCNVTNYLGTSLPGVNATIIITDPIDRVIFNRTYRTNGNGWIFPMPEFSLAADATQGTYNLSAIFSYRDTLVNYTSINASENNFTVTGVQVGGIEADIETNVIWYPDSNMTFVMTVYDAGSYTPVDPDAMDLVVYTGSPLFQNVYLQSNLSDVRMQRINFSNVTNASVGPYYTLTYVMPSTTPSGDYWARLDATLGTHTTTEWESFKVTRGGPYDVEVTPLENEVYREDYFDFEINIVNMGDTGQDVDVEFWVTSPDNDTWYYRNFTVFTPAAQNTTLTRSAYIYSTQPYGQNVIHVKVTYDTILLPIVTDATFLVIRRPAVTPPTPTPTPTPTPDVTVAKNITIIEYPSDIGIVRGWEDIRHVKVKNTGDASIDNVSLAITGIPSPWYTVKPSISRTLPPNNTTVFVITFNIPVNAMTGEYPIALVVSDGVIGDERAAKLTIFKSQRELVESELNKVKEKYAEVVAETDMAARYGKDVTEVRNILKEAKVHIDRAEAEFNAESYTEAMSHINTANELIRRAEEELGKTEYKPEMITRGIPYWLVLIIIIVFVGANVGIYAWRKKAYKKINFREDLLKIRDVIRTVKREGPAPSRKPLSPAAQEEKRKLAKVLDLLESEMKEGLITDKTYLELKKRTEKKMKNIK
jgi:uncharacterized membrane protein